MKIPLETRNKISEDLKNNVSVIDIINKYKISKATVSRIKKENVIEKITETTNNETTNNDNSQEVNSESDHLNHSNINEEVNFSPGGMTTFAEELKLFQHNKSVICFFSFFSYY